MTVPTGPARPASILTEFSRTGVEELSLSKSEPGWLRDARLAAWDVFERTNWPSGKEEEWRRLNLSGFRLDDYLPFSDANYAAATVSELPAALARAAGDDASLLVQHDSSAVFRSLSESLATKGVIFMDLDRAVREFPDIVREHLGRIVQSDATKYVALNSAFWSGGSFLYVPAGVEAELPVRALRWLGANGAGAFSRTLVVLGRGARAIYIDDYLSDASVAGFESGVVELVVGDGAELRYVSLQDWGAGITSFSHLRGQTGRDATINWLVVNLGGKLARCEVEASMQAPGARQELLGLFFGDKHQQFDIHTLQDHLAPNTTSDLLFKGVLKDSARSAFAGLIRVAPGAQRTDAYQANRNLLLSDKARADSIPTLEIEANDVRCTHGATVGPIDEEQQFYLMARGIPKGEADRMIVLGFLDPLLSRIPLDDVRARLDESIIKKMS